jgi:hypothetical protein
MRGLVLVLVWCSVADAFQAAAALTSGRAIRPVRSRMPVAQFDFFGGGKKKESSPAASSASDAQIPFKDPNTLTPEEGTRPWRPTEIAWHYFTGLITPNVPDGACVCL